MTEKELRQQVVDAATAWLGCKASDGSHRQIIDLYNAHKPLARGYKVTYTDSWCATFVSAVAIKCGLTDIMPTECSCAQMIALYKALGRWQENDAYVPSPGDLIMYDWDDNGVGDCTGAPEHVGLVTAVSGTSITVIEGNKSNAVGYRAIQVNGRYIRGYCTPDYAGKAAGMTIKEDEGMLTQEQFNAMMDKYLEGLAQAEPSTWSAQARQWAESRGIINGDEYGNRQYKKFCTREELAQILFNQMGG